MDKITFTVCEHKSLEKIADSDHPGIAGAVASFYRCRDCGATREGEQWGGEVIIYPRPRGAADRDRAALRSVIRYEMKRVAAHRKDQADSKSSGDAAYPPQQDHS